MNKNAALFLFVLLALAGLLAACNGGIPAEDRALIENVNAALDSHIATQYEWTAVLNQTGGVDVRVYWLADRGPGDSGLEMMVPEEADHAIWDMLEQYLTPADFARVHSVYFQRIELGQPTPVLP